jgi:Putative Actinobacterial Holin-X, holin superfamily III
VDRDHIIHSATSAGEPRAEPSVFDALVRVFEAGQRIVLDRIEMVRLDFDRATMRTLRGTVWVVVGAILTVSSWIGLMAALAMWLYESRALPLPASLVAVAVLTAVVGTAAIAAGLRGAAAENETPEAGVRSDEAREVPSEERTS